MAPDLDPYSIPRHSFTVARRGYDTNEVRAFLHEISDLVARLQRAEAELRERAERAETRAELEDELDEHRMIEVLGEETTRVLEAARLAAGEIRKKAEDTVANLTRAAHDDAARARAESEEFALATRAAAEDAATATIARAEGELARQSEEAHRVAAGIRAGAEREADALREEAEALLARAAVQSEEELEAARQEGRQMVAEAQAVRERVLKDLARRRRQARQQVEKLNAGRERLLDAYDVVRQTMDQATNELSVALPEARVLADAAARRIEEEPDASLEELEAEIDAARLMEPAPIDDDVERDDEPEAETETETAAAPEPAPEPEPEPIPAPEMVAQPVPDDEPFEERRSSSLRIFRRKQEERPLDLAEAELVPVEAPREDESVRLLEPDPAPEPEPVPHKVEVEVPIAVEPTVADAPSEPEPAEAEAPTPAVEELFARLKAERAETVAKAQATVAESDPAAGPQTSEPEPEHEPVETAFDADADPVDDVLSRRDEALEPVERELAKRLKRVLADEQNEVLDVLRRERPSSLDGALPTAAEHARRYAAVAGEPLLDAAAAGAGLIDAASSSVCDDLADELARTLVGPLRDRVERAFGEADDLDDVAEGLRSLYREWKGQRINDGARHFVTAAYARGVFDASADGCALRWLVDRSGDACPDADDNALAGEVGKGTPFPTGDLYPPAHPGCRCLVVPSQN